jgi:GntR family transcriptional regulator
MAADRRGPGRANVTEPLYRQIAQDLREQIESGGLPSGGRLPTEQQLSEKYRASRNTIRDAIKWLIRRTLVETRPGQGTFVAKPPAPFVITLSADQESALGGGNGGATIYEGAGRSERTPTSKFKVEIQSASADIKEALLVQAGTQVISRRQERYIDDQPWSLETSVYPMELATMGATALLTAEKIPGGAVAYLEEKLGLVQVGYRERILVRPPQEDEYRFFGLPDDGLVSVVSLIRTGYQKSQAGAIPFRVTTIVLPADRNQLVINVGDVPDALTAGVPMVAAPPRASSPTDRTAA